MGPARLADLAPARIVDIRSDRSGIELKQLIQDGLSVKAGEEKTLPTLLLYDTRGLKLFEKITYLDEYYLTGEEIRLLERYAGQIAERIPNNAIIVELGSGNLRKVKILLDALETIEKDVSYYALDLMQSELERTLSAIPEGSYNHVETFGLNGTYDDGLEWLKRPEHASRPIVVLSMGSSIGNFPRDDAVGFLQQFTSFLKPGDFFLLGVDACQEAEKVQVAYNDTAGITHLFTKNGLRHANELLGYEAFRGEDWDAIGEYDVAGGRHRAFVVPKKEVVVEGKKIEKGEKVRIEESYKYNRQQMERLLEKAMVVESAAWTNDIGDYGLHLLTKPSIMTSWKAEDYAAHPVPSLPEWHSLWAVWENVTRRMLPDAELHEKPIKLRNACIFYLGHIPTFFDIKLVEATDLPPTEPKYFYSIFERGIDPDVDNPAVCHAHSEIPDTWPELDEILGFQERVRQRVRELYKSGQAYDDAWTGRALWLGFEHEVMHLETLLYMLIQSDKTLPPADTVRPNFESIAAQAKRDAVPNEWFEIPEQTIQIGLDDPDNGEGPTRYFGWDVEKPATKVTVPAFKAQARPITNGEYARYLVASGSGKIPAAWVTISGDAAATAATSNGHANGVNGHDSDSDNDELEAFIKDKAVRTVYGPVSLRLAFDWPVSASYDELKGCAQHMGGRIPTMEEAKSIYEYAEYLNHKRRNASNILEKTIPAVNSHLINEGVRESPPSNPSPSPNGAGVTIPTGPVPSDVYIDLDTANVGFKHWHLMPVTPHGNTLAGQCGMGGLWEWTSSTLERREGFVPMKLYPAFSEDFYDGKHNVVLGGSWATHPRWAGRRSTVNWYQRNYPFVWAGARLVKDL